MAGIDINPGNALQKVQECQRHMTLNQWSQFQNLYPALEGFQEMRVSSAGGKGLGKDDEFSVAWRKLRASAVDQMLKNLESSDSYPDFMNWITKLSGILKDKQALWTVLHTEISPTLKVTLKQSHEIALKFFTPEMLFEYGLNSFIGSPLCDIKGAKTDEDLVDIFYGLAGFLRACSLPDSYEVKAPRFLSTVKDMLVKFTTIQNGDPDRLIWTVEAVRQHLRLTPATFMDICDKMLNEFAECEAEGQALSLLQRICVISKSPCLQELPVLQKAIDKLFKKAIEEQQRFMHRYLFGSFVTCAWDGMPDKEPGEPVRAWKIFIENLSTKLEENHALPKVLLVDAIDDSLGFFMGYYGEVQASKTRTANFRMDVLLIVDICVTKYPIPMSGAILKTIWYLLALVAVSGAYDEDLKDIKHVDCAERDEPYLGLVHTDREFEDYPLALSRLSKKFEEELEALPVMIDFVRKNYDS